MVHQRVQNGSLRKRSRSRGPAVWEFRYRVTDPHGIRRLKGVILGNVAEYPDKRSLQPKLHELRFDTDETRAAQGSNTVVSDLIDRFIVEECLSEIKAGKTKNASLHYSTACAYLAILTNYIRPKWDGLEL